MSNEQKQELIVLVDDDNKELGTAAKLSSHHADTPLHRGFSCYIFNDKGQLLVTQRALSKKVWPGVWTNSVCGHPGPGESVADAVKRRAHEELGMNLEELTPVLENYRYKTPAYSGIIENELCPVYAARASTSPNTNPDEVEDLYWSDWQDFINQATSNPDDFSYWCKDQLKQLNGHKVISRFLMQTDS